MMRTAGLMMVAAAVASGCIGPNGEPSGSQLTLVHPEPVRAVFEDAGGSLWVGFRDAGVAVIRGDSVENFTQGDGLASNGVASFGADRSGRIWVLGRGGYSVRDADGWRGHTRIGTLEPRVVFSMFEESGGGAVWLGTSAGAVRISDDSLASYTKAAGLPHDVVHAVHVDHDGGIWIATRAGLAWLPRVDGPVEVLRDDNVRTIVAAPDGALWFGTSDGVLELRDGRWRHHLRGAAVLPRFADAGGGIWAVSETDGVYRWNGSTWDNFGSDHGLPTVETFDIAPARRGGVWVATAEGLYRLRP